MQSQMPTTFRFGHECSDFFSLAVLCCEADLSTWHPTLLNSPYHPQPPRGPKPDNARRKFTGRRADLELTHTKTVDVGTNTMSELHLKEAGSSRDAPARMKSPPANEINGGSSVDESQVDKRLEESVPNRVECQDAECQADEVDGIHGDGSREQTPHAGDQGFHVLEYLPDAIPVVFNTDRLTSEGNSPVEGMTDAEQLHSESDVTNNQLPPSRTFQSNRRASASLYHLDASPRQHDPRRSLPSKSLGLLSNVGAALQVRKAWSKHTKKQTSQMSSEDQRDKLNGSERVLLEGDDSRSTEQEGREFDGGDAEEDEEEDDDEEDEEEEKEGVDERVKRDTPSERDGSPLDTEQPDLDKDDIENKTGTSDGNLFVSPSDLRLDQGEDTPWDSVPANSPDSDRSSSTEEKDLPRASSSVSETSSVPPVRLLRSLTSRTGE